MLGGVMDRCGRVAASAGEVFAALLRHHENDVLLPRDRHMGSLLAALRQCLGQQKTTAGRKTLRGVVNKYTLHEKVDFVNA